MLKKIDRSAVIRVNNYEIAESYVKESSPNAEIISTRETNIENMQQYFKNGVSCVEIGSSLLKSKNTVEIKKTDKKFVEKVNEHRESMQ